MADRAAGRDRLRCRNDGIRIDAIMAIKVGQRAGLAEMLDAERPHAMAGDRAKPGQRRRMSVKHADDAAIRRDVGEQPLNV